MNIIAFDATIFMRTFAAAKAPFFVQSRAETIRYKQIKKRKNKTTSSTAIVVFTRFETNAVSKSSAFEWENNVNA